VSAPLTIFIPRPPAPDYQGGLSPERNGYPMRSASLRAKRRRSLLAALAALVVGAALAVTTAAHADDGGVSDAPILGTWEVETLNGLFNNPDDPQAGAVGDRYLRIGTARYADGRSQPVSGPDPRYVSNRIFNDTNANVFSERGVTQWG